MGSCYGNGSRVVAHDLPQQFGSCEHGNSCGPGSGIFRIVRMDRGGVDNDIHITADIFRPLSEGDRCPEAFETAGECRPAGIGTGYGEAFF